MDDGSRRADVVQALRFGRALLSHGDAAAALAWLDRAWRLAPGTSSIAILLASALVDIDPERALDRLENASATGAESRDVAIAKIAMKWRRGDRADAAKGLADMLARHVPPRTDEFRRFADEVAAAAANGWVGADAAGAIYVSLPAGRRDVSIAIDLDGCTTHVRQTRPRARHQLEENWRSSHRLRATIDGRPLLGSPLQLTALREVRGIVWADRDGGISGCAWMNSDPDAVPLLEVRSDQQLARRVPVRNSGSIADRLPGVPSFARRFRMPPADVGRSDVLRVVDAGGKDLCGSPVVLSLPAMPQASPAPHLVPLRVPIDVIIPVYRGGDDLRRCITSLRQMSQRLRLIIVDDASDDPSLISFLDGLDRGDACVLRQPQNRGFPAAANAGLRHSLATQGGPRDVILLNPDTIVPLGWASRLADAAYSHAEIGSVTPMSHDGTIVSCDVTADPTAALDQDAVDRIDAWFAAANKGETVVLPTGVGFCLFIRHDCLASVGLLREDAFAQGYGEENDWCLRAEAAGWRHVAATGLFVAHAGGRSFGEARQLLMVRNAEVLTRLHPGYDARVRTFLRADKLRVPRRRAAARRWAAQRVASQATTLLVSHDLGGGTERHVASRARTLAAQGRRAIVLRLRVSEQGRAYCVVCDGTHTRFADLRFELPDELEALAELLRDDDPTLLEVHHFAGLPPHVLDLCRRLDIPYDIVVHDYALACPRMTFCGSEGQYCGEPADLAACKSCIAAVGSRLHETVTTADLRRRSANILRDARRIEVPCDDVARRLRRYFPDAKPAVTPLEPAVALAKPPEAADDIRICVVGAIGQDKGYDILLKCAQDADRRALKLRFVVVGHTIDDRTLIGTDRVFVTGEYAEADAVALIRAQRAAIGFIPSVCPETWSFALSALWQTGLAAVSFAIGAPAERIRASGHGWVLPLGAPPSWINDRLLGFSVQRRMTSHEIAA